MSRFGSRFAERAVVAGTAVGIVTLAVNVMGMKAITSDNAAPPRASYPTASTAAASPTMTATQLPPARSIPAGPYAVENLTVSLVDPSRDTPARGDVPAHGGRTLTTVIRRPIGLPGPLPLVVFAHG
jgi:hypothetical protein